MRTVAALTGLLAWAALVQAPPVAAAQDVGRAAVEALDPPPLRFDPPTPSEYRLSNGVTVFHLQDSTLPLVEIQARFEGGYARFPRERYAAGTALPSLLRNGGTRALAPEEVDRRLERLAVQTTFGGSGGSVTASLNTLTEQLGPALRIWAEMLREPGFDTGRIAVWRNREMENVLRRTDDPGRLAFSEFNHLLYGDHPVGWEMTVEDLAPDRLTRDRFHWLHQRIVCPGNLMMGVSGDVRWDEIRPLLEDVLSDWPQCAEPLPPPPEARVGAPPGVYLIPRPLTQSTVVLAHPTELRQGPTREYFASRIGNAILGAGGLSSRLLGRLRTEEGLAYGAASLWTTPRRYEGLLGATTRTRTEATSRAIGLILEAMEGMAEAPPSAEEVATTVDQTVNGYVFNFESGARIVSRQLSFRASDLPDDWLERYVEGIQAVRPEDVQEVYRRYLDVREMVILVVGDPELLGDSLETLGPVTLLEVAPVRSPSPSGGPRSRR